MNPLIGMEEGEFSEARKDLAALEKDYKKAGLVTIAYEVDSYDPDYDYWGKTTRYKLVDK